jgi:hypothetical protein
VRNAGPVESGGPGSTKKRPSHGAMGSNGQWSGSEAVRARHCMMKQEKDLIKLQVTFFAKMEDLLQVIQALKEEEVIEKTMILMGSKIEWASGCCLGTCHLRHEGKRNFFLAETGEGVGNRVAQSPECLNAEKKRVEDP